jgi:hypothetical protein
MERYVVTLQCISGTTKFVKGNELTPSPKVAFNGLYKRRWQ